MGRGGGGGRARTGKGRMEGRNTDSRDAKGRKTIVPNPTGITDGRTDKVFPRESFLPKKVGVIDFLSSLYN